jgi:hypothetical protein
VAATLSLAVVVMSAVVICTSGWSPEV